MTPCSLLSKGDSGPGGQWTTITTTSTCNKTLCTMSRSHIMVVQSLDSGPLLCFRSCPRSTLQLHISLTKKNNSTPQQHHHGPGPTHALPNQKYQSTAKSWALENEQLQQDTKNRQMGQWAIRLRDKARSPLHTPPGRYKNHGIVLSVCSPVTCVNRLRGQVCK